MDVRTPVPLSASNPPLAELTRELDSLRAEMQRFEAVGLAAHGVIDPSFELSASNLLHYLALRRRDLRSLQERLMELGLSSLGRCEAHAMATIEAVLGVLHRLQGAPQRTGAAPGRIVPFSRGKSLLDAHTDALLGPSRSHRRVRILVTMPDEAAEDASLAKQWIESGMDLARINCAHGDADQWKRMVEHVRRAERAAGRTCRILMDLAGPKLRTGPLEPGPAVLKVRPERDRLGCVVRPALLWLTPNDAARPAPTECDATLPIDGAALGQLEPGARIVLEDARGASREWLVLRRLRGGVWAESASTCYLVPGLRIRGTNPDGGEMHLRIGDLERRPGELLLAPGDELLLMRSLEPGREAEREPSGRVLVPAYIGCTLPEVFDQVGVGESVWFDDGRIGARVVANEGDRLRLQITTARESGEKLRADKGINLPDSRLRLPALTEKDCEDLPFVVEHADAVALSFVHDADDVVDLERRVAALGRPDLGIVLKIETRRAFEQLPRLLLSSMKSSRAGVMIARGDLAVECGFERLAEVQEEILWLCEAAHVPVIWATQVLETLAKEGRPSRAEITDAAMSERAECVMLNKGPHIAQAVSVLDDILRRMEGHQRKKSAMLRPLRVAASTFE
jgi:pyruvate kinase